ncbi:MAG: hypothetical protein IIU14_01330 [Ruminococcus sp.]|nr:hypothetical protein [Ruminococcus sp.]
MFEDFPNRFSSALKENFCAMKYVSCLSDKRRKKLVDEVERMNDEEMRKCVSELAKKIF